MDWREALETVVGRTKHERFRALCAEDHPDHAAHRARVVAMATGTAPVAYPSVGRQAANLMGAIGRAAGAIVSGDPVLVPPEILAARKLICGACPNFDPAAGRCRLCGCWTDQKQRLATEACPDAPRRWDRWEKP